MTNHPDHVNRLEAAQSLIALHVGKVLIVLVISHSNHLNDDVKNGAVNMSAIFNSFSLEAT